MNFLDLTLSSPAANLACDEALLDWREENGGTDILRFWESPEPFVVVGYANKILAEVDSARCAAEGVPVLRRCSGGGTILQGPGCLNYALILNIDKHASLTTISGANKFIMDHNRTAVQTLAGDAVVRVHGHTDLAIAVPSNGNGRDPLGFFQKFSGNSQRRHKNFLLFHGTLLLNFDLGLIGKYLKFPSRQPDYRNDRSHAEFLTNVNLPASAVKAALRNVWLADEPLENPPEERVFRLTREKYETAEWNRKFFDL